MTNTLTWLGHASFMVTTDDGKVVLIDPWLSGNPVARIAVQDLPKADLVLITHDHTDHASDCVAVGHRTGAVVIGQPETVARYSAEGLERAESMNIGGTIERAGIAITMVDACHTSETGVASGYVMMLPDGKVIYHAGDTGLHANMKLWGEIFDIDVALLPIGGRYTMDGAHAARALAMLGARRVVPMHFATFPFLAANAELFVREAARLAPDARVDVLEVGASIHI